MILNKYWHYKPTSNAFTRPSQGICHDRSVSLNGSRVTVDFLWPTLAYPIKNKMITHANTLS